MQSTRKLNVFLEMFSYYPEDYSAVLVITEEGCPVCNRSFANLVKNYLDHPKALCIVSASGNKIDVSPFLETDRVIMDMENTFQALNITNGTSSIFLKPSGVIDTILAIQAASLEQDLIYISRRLNSSR